MARGRADQRRRQMNHWSADLNCLAAGHSVTYYFNPIGSSRLEDLPPFLLLGIQLAIPTPAAI